MKHLKRGTVGNDGNPGTRRAECAARGKPDTESATRADPVGNDWLRTRETLKNYGELAAPGALAGNDARRTRQDDCIAAAGAQGKKNCGR
jgi:hypothetical protein